MNTIKIYEILVYPNEIGAYRLFAGCDHAGRIIAVWYFDINYKCEVNA